MGGEQRAAIAHMAHVNAVPDHHHHQRTTATKKYVFKVLGIVQFIVVPLMVVLFHGGFGVRVGVNGKRERENTIVTLFVVGIE